MDYLSLPPLDMNLKPRIYPGLPKFHPGNLLISQIFMVKVQHLMSVSAFLSTPMYDTIQT